ncbi:MAG: prepilin-type N-terminal cleavage/methylation domain-containing protein [Candidatus Woesebacteria bacterium]|nr:prepilin-type N-terminal cleavage/methylation domain-containing protein [Candidatus Woesebacteria bacterium]
MRKGYTLIEVLISLTIIGLLFGFGFASFRDFSRRQHLAGVARTIKGELRLVQGKASAAEKPAGCDTKILSSYSFHITPPSSYEVIANCSGGVNVTVKTENLPDGVTMISTQNTISFKVLGQGTNIVSVPIVITFTQAGTNNKSYVTVTAGGEIK